MVVASPVIQTARRSKERYHTYTKRPVSTKCLLLSSRFGSIDGETEATNSFKVCLMKMAVTMSQSCSGLAGYTHLGRLPAPTAGQRGHRVCRVKHEYC